MAIDERWVGARPWRPPLPEWDRSRTAAAAAVELVRSDLSAGHIAAAAQRAGWELTRPTSRVDRQRLLGLHALALARLGDGDGADAADRELMALDIPAEPSTADDRAGQAPALACAAEAALWSGLPRRALERAGRALLASGDAHTRSLALLARAWAEIDLGRQPITEVLPVWPRSAPGVEAELRAIAALGRSEVARAASGFRRAAAVWADLDTPREAICRWAAADARRSSGDNSGALPELREALETAIAMGFEPLAARVRRSLRLAGERHAAALPRPFGGILTGRERQVIDLVARGRTNADIARRMGLGRPTVARLLSNAMVKLGADSRAQAVVLAAGRPAVAEATVPALCPDGRAILALLAEGVTLGAAASSLGLSRRTADRRLAEARAALHVERTVEAVARLRHPGRLPLSSA